MFRLWVSDNKTSLQNCAKISEVHSFIHLFTGSLGQRDHLTTSAKDVIGCKPIHCSGYLLGPTDKSPIQLGERMHSVLSDSVTVCVLVVLGSCLLVPAGTQNSEMAYCY